MKNKQVEKTRLHPRNKNRDRYDLAALIAALPTLKNHIIPNKLGDPSVNFANPLAVRLLNTALLKHYYGIDQWEFPQENLCPPIPGRADYIHHIADLLGASNFGQVPTGETVNCLDIGVGASCIYPIIGSVEYGWKFIGSDIDPRSIASAQQIVTENSNLNNKINCRLQSNTKAIFRGVIKQDEYIELTLCNPPFHSSMEEAQKGTRRKIKNLTGKKVKIPPLNFAGASNELVCDGGEYSFIQGMIRESEDFAKNCFWFTTLVSKQSHLKGIELLLKNSKTEQVKIIPMGTSNKASRIVAWSFLNQEEQNEWRKNRWKKSAMK